jgi:1,4-dihydroxy-2-naphthoyl-CoA hydrolase
MPGAMRLDRRMCEKSPTDLVHQLIPLCATLGVCVDQYQPEEVSLSVEWAPGLCTSGGILHGGIIMAVADSAAALCAYLNLPQGAGGTATIEAKTNFVAAVRSGTVRAAASPVHIGSRTIVIETDVTDGQGRLVAKVLQTQAVL